MKKKIALIITIAVCIVSVSANVYQYRVIRNKDAQIVWNQTTEDQMFQGILGHIQEEILYLQTCEPDEKDFRIGVAFGYCREAVNAYITTSYGASWKEHDLQQMVSEFEGYLENLQSDETQWKNAKNGDLDRLYDAWSEVLTQIDKGKKARVAAASKVILLINRFHLLLKSGVLFDFANHYYAAALVHCHCFVQMLWHCHLFHRIE